MPVDVVVSLDLYEKKLIDSFQTTFFANGAHLIHNPRRHLSEILKRWHWSLKILQDSQYITYGDDWCSTHQGDRQVIWDALLRRLEKESNTYYSCHSKLTKLLANNPDLEARFKNEKSDDVPDLEVVPAPDEECYWDVVVDLNFIEEAGLPNLTDAQIAPLVEKLSEALRGSSAEKEAEVPRVPDDFGTENIDLDTAETETDKLDQILGAEGLNHEYTREDQDNSLGSETDDEVPRRDRDLEIWSLVRSCATLCRGDSDRLKLVRMGLRQSGFYEKHESYADGYVHKKYSHYGRDRYIWAFSDPVKYLEYVPWEDLSIPDTNARYGKMHWKPRKSIAHDHHLRTEEEVFKFCIEQEFFFPGHMDGDSIIFMSSSLREAKLLDEMGDFWEKGNDCAISRNPTTEEWILLETVPGQRFRKLWDNQSQVAGLNYFRRIVDDHRNGRIKMLNEVLGLESSSAEYDGLLEAIPFSEITHVDPTPLAGSNGVVYRAMWACPQKVDMIGPETRPVALKTMRDVGIREMKRFLDELDAVFSALQSVPVRCIEFYGITRTPKSNHNKDAVSSLRPDTIFLVFEWALKGSLIDYLSENLSGEATDWELILDCMEDLAVGIESIHGKNIVHRDIHRNNVLVTTHPTPNDPFTRESTDLVISDLGEGRASDSGQSVGRKYYGNVEFWAPEVKRSHKYSFLSDIYAIGYLMADMVQERWKIVQIKTGRVDRLAPKPLLDIIKLCISSKPEERPNAEDLRKSLENLHSDVLKKMEDGEYRVVFTDMVDPTKDYLGQMGMTEVIDDDGQVDEDGIPF